jgi:tetratricopeptide (TPR) repeat protein
MFREQPEGDVGIDGHLEIIGPEGQATGRIVGVQVKGGPSFFSHPGVDGWTVYIPKATVRYWRQYAVPVIIVIADLEVLTAYWARVDRGDFEETQESFKVVVPKSQTFDNSAVVPIAALAANAPASLAATLDLPEALAEKRRSIRAAYSQDPEQNREQTAAAAARGVELARELRAAGFPYESGREHRDAVRAFFRAGEGRKATEELVLLGDWAQRELRDPTFARSLLETGTFTESPDGGTELPAVLQMRLDYLRAEADAYSGIVQTALDVAPRLEAVAATAGGELAIAAHLDALRLRVLVALAHDDLATSAGLLRAQLQQLDVVSVDAAAEDPQRRVEVGWTRLRALLFAGVPGDAAASLELVQALQLPDLLDLDRKHVIGWLQAAAGRYEEAAATFEQAAEGALAISDNYSALRAYRNAAWAEERAPRWSREGAHPSLLAARLEPIVEASVRRESTHERLTRRIASNVARNHLREAILSAHVVRALAWESSDPAAEEDARVQTASILRAAALDSAREDYILHAIAETARTFALVEGEGPAMSAFAVLIDGRLTGEFTGKVFGSLVERIRRPEEVVGALRFATRFASRWIFDGRDDALAEILMRGIDLGWHGVAMLNGAHASYQLIESLEPPLRGAGAAKVRDRLIDSVNETPPGRLLEALNAIAVVSAEASLGDEEVSKLLTERLFALEARASQEGATPQWAGALAMLSRSVTQDAAEGLKRELKTRAQAVMELPVRSVHHWHVVERALAAGLEFADAAANDYLLDCARLLDTLSAQVGTGALGGGAGGDIGALTVWAISRAGVTTRETALDAAISYLLNQGHILTERVQWIPFIARVAALTPKRLSAAVAALTSTARGELQPVGMFDSFLDPFSGIRVVGHTPERVRGVAYQWLATLIPTAEPDDRAGILAVLSDGARSSSPELREDATTGAGWALRSIGYGAEMAAAATQVAALLTELGHDPVDRIAASALRALQPTNAAAGSPPTES